MVDRTPANPRRNAGFTVVELLVAIAVLAIISSGLAMIFASVGDAVTDGRRVSELNRAAARIETQIRADLEQLTRDGFLVVVNRYATDEDGVVFGMPGAADENGVRLSPRDTLGRPRRVDEFMFFARGDFQTKRPAIAPGMIATSSEAAIYYGLGQRRPIDLRNINNASNFYFNPHPTDANVRRPIWSPGATYRPLLGQPESPGSLPNPNRYARDWTLLRQATLLAEPKTVSVLPESVYGWRRDNLQDRTILMDSARQIALQPAARSIFNSLSWSDPGMFGSPGSVPDDAMSRWWVGDFSTAGRPGLASQDARAAPAWRASGVVDVAQGDVLTIRRQFEALAAYNTPGDYAAPSVFARPAGGGRPSFNQTADAFAVQWDDHLTHPAPWSGKDLNLTAHRDQIRAWALDMLPSLWDGESIPPRHIAGVRYEPLPTRLIHADRVSSDQERLARAIAEANQEMLASQVFVPRCSEFIVEWSFGYVDPSLSPGDPKFKQIRWHGLPRADRDTNGDDRIDLTDHANTNWRIVERYEKRTGSGLPNPLPDPEREHLAMVPSPGNPLTDPEVAVFGLAEAANAIQDNVVAPWPRLIRITMSLADPEDETVERTYQFVFAVPGAQG